MYWDGYDSRADPYYDCDGWVIACPHCTENTIHLEGPGNPPLLGCGDDTYTGECDYCHTEVEVGIYITTEVDRAKITKKAYELLAEDPDYLIGLDHAPAIWERNWATEWIEADRGYSIHVRGATWGPGDEHRHENVHQFSERIFSRQVA